MKKKQSPLYAYASGVRVGISHQHAHPSNGSPVLSHASAHDVTFKRRLIQIKIQKYVYKMKNVPEIPDRRILTVRLKIRVCPCSSWGI